MTFSGMSILVQAMDDSSVSLKLNLHKHAQESSLRKTIKDGARLDIAYAEIPIATIDMNSLDPLENKQLKDLDFTQRGTVLARVQTADSFYYCKANGLHKKLGMDERLQEISAYKDPRDNETPLCAIYYYTLTDDFCSDCKIKYKNKKTTAFKDFKNFIEQQPINAESKIQQTWDVYHNFLTSLNDPCTQCNLGAFGLITQYEKSKFFKGCMYLYGIGVDDDHKKAGRLLKPALDDAQKLANISVQRPLCFASLCVIANYLRQARCYSGCRMNKGALLECDACLKYLKYIRDYGLQDYPFSSEPMRAVLDGAHEVVMLMKKIENFKIQQEENTETKSLTTVKMETFDTE